MGKGERKVNFRIVFCFQNIFIYNPISCHLQFILGRKGSKIACTYILIQPDLYLHSMLLCHSFVSRKSHILLYDTLAFNGKFKCSKLNPFPNKPLFLHVCSTGLLKTLWEKEELLVMSIFCFSHSVFYPFGELSAIFIK